MKIAIGGLKKNVMEEAIHAAAPQVETIITTDIAAVPMLKNGQVDYYFGACESGGGAAISILIGMVGYSKCCTVAKNGQVAKKEDVVKQIAAGKIVFGMAHDTIDKTVPVLLEALLQAQQ
ncbi:DUF2620 family protein [Oscillospiraceae bacterium PP1C4]